MLNINNRIDKAILEKVKVLDERRHCTILLLLSLQYYGTCTRIHYIIVYLFHYLLNTILCTKYEIMVVQDDTIQRGIVSLDIDYNRKLPISMRWWNFDNNNTFLSVTFYKFYLGILFCLSLFDPNKY